MQIVDAQIHVWGAGLPSNASHWQVTSFPTEQAVALMDEAGVHAAIIHPPSWDPDCDAMAAKAVRDYPGRFAIMGALPLDKPDTAGRIAAWRQQPNMLGLRYTFLHEPARGLHLLRALGDRQDHAQRRSQPAPHRGRRTRMDRSRRLQHRGRLLREGDQPLARG